MSRKNKNANDGPEQDFAAVNDLENKQIEKEINDTPHYQEWDVRISSVPDPNNEGKVIRSIEKLKVARKVVKITDREAEVLNEGAKHGANTYAKMYFLPE